MTHLPRWTAFAAATLAPLCLLSAAVAHNSARDPVGTVRITPATGGATRNALVPVAGSSGAVVYVQSPRNAARGNPSLSRVMTRSLAGRVTDLGTAPVDPDGKYSLSSSSLTESDGGNVVHWWDLAAHTRGVITLGSDSGYVTSAPGGFVYRTGATLYLRTYAGAVTSLGQPFPSTGSGASQATASGDSGMVVAQGDAAVYLSFANPGGYRTLNTGGRPANCSVVAGNFAACLTSYSSGARRQAELLPIDGRAPVLLPETTPNAVALAGTTLISLDGTGALRSRTYSSSAERTSTTRFGPFLTSAFGRAIVEPVDYTRLWSLPSAAATPSALVTAPYGPPTASWVSLSAGQLVYNDDRRNAAVPPGRSSTFRTWLPTSAASLRLGTTKTLAAGDVGAAVLGDGSSPTTPGGSGTTIMHASEAHYSRDRQTVTETLVVTGPRRSRTIKYVITNYFGSVATPPSLSGNRLVYFAETGTGHPAFFRYDVAKDSITRIQSFDEQAQFVAIPALSGRYLGYLEPDGSVWREDLNTGRSVRVAPGLSGYGGGSVFVNGDYVAWARVEIVDADHDTVDSGYRDAKTMAPAQDLSSSGDLVGLSDSGPVLRTTGNLVLRTYAGGDVTLADSTGTVPQVVGRTEAWIDADGTAKVAPVDVTAPRPVFEGATLAPRPAHPDQVVWHPYAPYSAPLTRCSATVSSGSRTLVTLPCDTALMRLGVADIAWNGRIGSKPAAAGTYHYVIIASGDGGSALDSGGNARPVTGHFTITR